MSENIAVLVESDYCVGCYACQTACQEYNHLPVEQTYMRCTLTKPERVDGDITSFMSAVPLALHRCAECIEREGGGSLREDLHRRRPAHWTACGNP